jgi:hypothetical protein
MIEHISDHDLERYYLGMVVKEVELAALEEHILGCAACARTAEETQDYVDAMRSAALDLVDLYGGQAEMLGDLTSPISPGKRRRGL